MNDWTPWPLVALMAVGAVFVLGMVALGAWYSLTLSGRVRESSDLNPDDQAARRLGEAIGESARTLTVEVADEVLAIFARSSGEQRRVLVAVITGLFADGRHLDLPDLNARVLAAARRLGSTETATERPSAKG